MKKKLYEKPTVKVVQLQHQCCMQMSSPGGTPASMPGTFEEIDI